MSGARVQQLQPAFLFAMQDPDFPPNETSVGEVAAIKSGFNGTLKWCALHRDLVGGDGAICGRH